VLKDGTPIILVEVKCWNVSLERVHESQLFRYFSVTTPKVSILTNGVQYKFFADTESANRMDERPFYEFDIRTMKKADYEALRRFAKGTFDGESVATAAQELMFTQGIVNALHSEFANPSEEFVRFLAKLVYSGTLGKNAKELFAQIVKRAQQQSSPSSSPSSARTSRCRSTSPSRHRLQDRQRPWLPPLRRPRWRPPRLSLAPLVPSPMARSSPPRTSATATRS